MTGQTDIVNRVTLKRALAFGGGYPFAGSVIAALTAVLIPLRDDTKQVERE